MIKPTTAFMDSHKYLHKDSKECLVAELGYILGSKALVMSVLNNRDKITALFEEYDKTK